MAVTLKDIAARVGLSVNSVSRALRDKQDIALDTRRRVKAVASELGYRPNLNARSLVLKQSFSIGVAVTELNNPVRMDFCERLRQLAEQDGYRIICAGISHHHTHKDLDTIADLQSRGVDGLVLGYFAGPLADQPIAKILEDCEQSGLPVTLFGSPDTSLADYAFIDFRDSCYRLTCHMLDLGIVPTGFFSHQPETGLVGDRVRGYLQAMTDRGLRKQAKLWPVKIIDGYLPAAARAMQGYLARHERPPRGIIAANDMIAIGIISTLRQHGIQVPDDVAVASFDNIEIGEFISPPLTTMGFDNGFFATQIWDLLKHRIDNKKNTPRRQLHLRHELITRQSCP
jgi:DNA-binding LacI/PurR family transcriptional regulator